MSEQVLSIRDINVHFPNLTGSTHVLRGVNLDLAHGEILGVVGESGSGKSMTGMAIMGMVPRPGQVSGKIELEGRDIVRMSAEEREKLRGRKVAMIFQNPLSALNPFFSIERQMCDVILQNGTAKSRSQARQVALDQLTDVRIPDVEGALRKYPHQMSGGQLQRVMIAMALACAPELIIADEPTTALDVTIQEQIIMLLHDLARNRGISILFITHDLGLVSRLCDRVAVMYAGEVIECGTVAQVVDTPTHPYTRRLLATVPQIGRGEEELAAIPGLVPNLAETLTGCAFAERCEFAETICHEKRPPMRVLPPGENAVSCHLFPRTAA